MKLRAKSLFTLFYAVFFGGVVFLSLGYNAKARLIPLVVAVPCLAMALAQLFLELRKERGRARSLEDDLFHSVMGKVVHTELPAEPQPKKERRARDVLSFLVILGWILGFYASVYLLGFMITIPLFTVTFMRRNAERWTPALLCAGGLWLTMYLVFSVIAKITLHEGLIFTLLAAQ